MFKRQPAPQPAASQPDASASTQPEGSEPEPEEVEESPEEIEQTEGAESSPEQGEESRDGREEGEGEEGTEQEPETTEAQTETPAALPTELAEAIAELKADGKGGQAKLLKRLHTVVDQRDSERNRRLESEQRLTEAEEQLKSKPTEASPTTAPADLVAQHPEVAQVTQAIAQVDGYIQWCKANKEGGEVPDGKGGKTFLDADAVAEILDNARNRRTELVAVKAQRAETVRNATKAAHQEFHGVAVKAYPWLEKRESAQRQEMDAILQQAPFLKQFPNYELVIADMFRGRAARESASKAPAVKPMVKPKGGNIPPKVVAEPSATRQPADPKRKDISEADTQFEKSGKTDDLARTFAARRRAKRS